MQVLVFVTTLVVLGVGMMSVVLVVLSGDNRRLGGHSLLGHSGRDGGFGVNHGANGDVGCHAFGDGDRGGCGRDDLTRLVVGYLSLPGS